MDLRPLASATGDAKLPSAGTELPRRGFLYKAAAVIFGGITAVVPALAGCLFFLDPLGIPLDPRRKKKATLGGGKKGLIKVTTVDSLPAGGQPVRFTLIADRTDAWNTFINEPIGAVYLRKTEQGEIVAFNVACPHLGCSVDYKAAGNHFHCPCHDSSFAISGDPQNKIPPRGLDGLEVDAEKLKQGEVWVKFQNFRAGVEEKIPKA
jgi:menaquinol-cytochrome c reductase iron-sulfur subunit